MSQTASQGHPRGLYILFFTEMWERFSYYGMRAIFILFLTKGLFMSSAEASNIYGSYTGLVYLSPLLGGYICDRYWGNRRSILVGGIMMAIGQFLLYFSGDAVTQGSQSATSVSLMMAGLTCLIMGNGFFKPNISTMVGQLYPANDSRIDAAFTIFYMGINMGAFFSPFICGGLGDTNNIADFKYGFLAAGIGMVISSISFEAFKSKYLVSPTGEPLGMPKKPMEPKTYGVIIGSVLLMYVLINFKSLMGSAFGPDSTLAQLDLVAYMIYASMIIMPLVILSDKSLEKHEKERIYVIFILAFFVIFFWACFEQAGASLTLFADTQVNRAVQINLSAYVIAASGMLAVFYLFKALGWFFEWTNRIIRSFQTGFIALIAGALVSGYIQDLTFDEFPASWFQSVNPLTIIVLAPFMSMLWLKMAKANIEPSSPLKMAIGLALVALGYVVIAYAVHGVDAQTKIAMFWLFALYIIHTVGELCLSPIGLSMVSKLAPLRLSSLMMGTWFLANAAANKFAGTLSALIPPGAGEAPVEAGTAMPSILGIEISNLFIFFCVFIVLSGAAALLLIFLYRKLIKLMHGVN